MTKGVTMALDLWYPDDVRRILLGLARAASRYTDAEYRQAYHDALTDAAVSFGVLRDGVRWRQFFVDMACLAEHVQVLILQ